MIESKTSGIAANKVLTIIFKALILVIVLRGRSTLIALIEFTEKLIPKNIVCMLVTTIIKSKTFQ